MTEQVTYILQFQFSTLRKHMRPFYSRMNQYLDLSPEQKREVIRTLVAEFFSRLRSYREISVEDLALKTGIPTTQIIQFERGELPSNRLMEDHYCRVCCGEEERLYFAQQIHEFLHPTIKENKDSLAMAALKQHGVMLTGIDYKNIGATNGQVLRFPSSSASDS